MVSGTRVITGLLVWLALTIGFCIVGVQWSLGSGQKSLRQLSQYAFYPRSSLALRFPAKRQLAVGDPVFMEIASGELKLIGTVRQVVSRDSTARNVVFTEWADAMLFSNAPKIQPGDYLTYHQTPTSMDWVLQVMLPPEKRAKIAQLIAQAYANNYQEIYEDMKPILDEAFREASAVIREELIKAIVARAPQWRDIGERYRLDILEKELIPLVNDEIWPIVQVHLRPLAEKIGAEIWAETSFWQFGWKALYDWSVLPQRDLTRKEFDKFVRDEATPILVSHVPDFLNAQRRILEAIAANPEVQEAVRTSVRKIVNDRELQQLAIEILQDVFVRNPRVAGTFERIWNSPQTQQLLKLTDARLEPTVFAIGAELFGTPRGGIPPEFSRVLRNKVLLKDSRWLVLRNDGSGEHISPDPAVLIAVDGVTGTENPFFEAPLQRQ